MQYTQGSIGRVFIIKFEDRDDLLEELKSIAQKENIKAATIMLLGGMRGAGIVAGPKKPVIPPEPMWVSFDDGREVLAFGTLFWKGNEPAIHLHGAVGTRAGHPRRLCQEGQFRVPRRGSGGDGNPGRRGAQRTG